MYLQEHIYSDLGLVAIYLGNKIQIEDTGMISAMEYDLILSREHRNIECKFPCLCEHGEDRVAFGIDRRPYLSRLRAAAFELDTYAVSLTTQ